MKKARGGRWYFSAGSLNTVFSGVPVQLFNHSNDIKSKETVEEQDEIRALVEKAKQLDDKELKPIQSLFSNLSGHLQAAFRLEKEVNKTEESHSQPKTGADSVEPSAPDNGGLKDGGEPETHKSEENNKDPGSKESD